MKATNLLLALCLMLFTISFVSAQTSKESKTIEFKVTGNCEMCKKTIESSLKNEDGIKSGVWNQKRKMMKVTFEPFKISEGKIHEKIAASGYDTEKKEASDKAYKALPGCCQYDRTLQKGSDKTKTEV